MVVREHGPIFGFGCDIWLRDEANKRPSVTYNACAGYSYLNKGEGNVICGGSLVQSKEGRFLATEYEMFEIM